LKDRLLQLSHSMPTLWLRNDDNEEQFAPILPYTQRQINNNLINQLTNKRKNSIFTVWNFFI